MSSASSASMVERSARLSTSAQRVDADLEEGRKTVLFVSRQIDDDVRASVIEEHA
jgi:hypothetical protein